MQGLEQALTVRHIAAFEVLAGDPDENAAALFAQFPDYDQFPAKKGGSVIGVVERLQSIGDETIRAYMGYFRDKSLDNNRHFSSVGMMCLTVTVSPSRTIPFTTTMSH